MPSVISLADHRPELPPVGFIITDLDGRSHQGSTSLTKGEPIKGPAGQSFVPIEIRELPYSLLADIEKRVRSRLGDPGWHYPGNCLIVVDGDRAHSLVLAAWYRRGRSGLVILRME